MKEPGRGAHSSDHTSPPEHAEGSKLGVLFISDSRAAPCPHESPANDALSRYSFVHATSLEQALDYSGQRHFHAAVVDLRTPGGFAALASLVEREPWLPILAFGPGDADAALRALRLGAREYLDIDHLDSANLSRYLAQAVERAQMEQNLRDSEHKYKIFVDHSPDGYMVVDIQQTVLEVNQRTCEIFGYSKDELVGARVDSLILPEEVIAQPFRVNEVMSGRTVLRERTIIRKDGTTLPIEGTTRALPDGNVEIVVRDITERKEAAEALRQSEERYRSLVEILPDFVTLTDLEGFILFCNRRALEMNGFTSLDQIVGRNAFDFIAPEDREKAREATLATLGEGSVHNVEYKLLTARGERYDGLASATTVYDKDGNPSGFISVVRDITDRKQVEEELRLLNEQLEQRVAERTGELRSANEQLRSEIAERTRIENELRTSEERFARAFHSSPDAIAISRVRDSVIIDANESFYRMTGYPREEVLGSRSPDTGIWAVPEERLAMIHAVKEGRVVRDYPWHLHRKSGEILDALLSVEIIEVGGEACFLNICHDVTEQKRAEDALRLANAGLQIAMGELEAFSYSVSHDLQAPLRAIGGYATALLDEYANNLDAEGLRYLARIQANTRNMSDLIEDLLLFSRAARQEMTTVTVDMTRLVSEVADGLDRGRPRGGLEVKIEDLPRVQGDEAMLRALLTNLLGNAAKFTRPVEHAIVEVGSYPDPEAPGERQVFFVRDNGVGFDMQYRNKLFIVFQRLHASAEFEGTGVGLAIVQRIVHRHGGRVWAEGAVGEGAAFYFSLPLALHGIMNSKF